MQTNTYLDKTNLKRLLAQSVSMLCLAAAAIPGFAQTDGRVYYNQEVEAATYTSESHPLDDFKVGDLGSEVGYITHKTSITFQKLVIQEDSKPTAVKITYASGSAGGKVRLIVDQLNSSRTLGIVLGTFDLPSTGGWNRFTTVTLPIRQGNFELNYLRRGVAPLRMEFKNPDATDYLFNIASFEIKNASQSAPFAYNKWIDAALFSTESHPGNDSKVLGIEPETFSYGKVGNVKHGTWIQFDNFDIPTGAASNYIPTSVTITYSSGGPGGRVKIVSDSYNSNRELGVTLGNFDLPSTGDWSNHQTVTFPIDANFEHNYLRTGNPLRLEFKNPDTDGYLFDIVEFKINK